MDILFRAISNNLEELVSTAFVIVKSLKATFPAPPPEPVPTVDELETPKLKLSISIPPPGPEPVTPVMNKNASTAMVSSSFHPFRK